MIINGRIERNRVDAYTSIIVVVDLLSFGPFLLTMCELFLYYLNYSFRPSANAIMCSLAKASYIHFPWITIYYSKLWDAVRVAPSNSKTNMNCNIWSGRATWHNITNFNASGDSRSLLSFRLSVFSAILFGVGISCVFVGRRKCKKYTLDCLDTKWKITTAHRRDGARDCETSER